jgi:hypothetical protein
MLRGDAFGRIHEEILEIVLESGALCLRNLGRTKEAREWEDAAAKLAAE